MKHAYWISALVALLLAVPFTHAQDTVGDELTGTTDDTASPSSERSESGVSASSTASIHLELYQLVKGPIVLDASQANVSDIANVSGMTYNKARNSLFLVMNDPEVVLEYDLHKDSVQRVIYLEGFEDTEDIVWMSNNRFGIIEERRQNLVIINLPTAGNYGANFTQTAYYKNAVKYNIDPVNAGNEGLEGVAYDPISKHFFVVKEKEPAKIYNITEPTYGLPTVKNPYDLDANNFGCTDFSGVYFHSQSQHLILLSDEGKAAIETTQDGTEVSRLSLSGLNQPEGICMGLDGTLYIASEPNSLYFYKKP